MTQEIDTSRSAVFEYVERNLDITNEALYKYYNAITQKQKDKVRRYKNECLKLISQKPPTGGIDISRKNKQRFKQKLDNISIPELILRFRNFCGWVDKQGNIHEGEAFPPPIDEKGNYLGILVHELYAFLAIWEYVKHGILFKWPRGFGKTYIFTWFIEFTLKEFAWPWLYLSSTAILSDVAFWIFKWAVRNNLLPKATPFQGSKKNTYRGFDLVNGAMFRIYDYMTEDMVGQHKWYIAMDDIVKRKWENKPSENRNAKRQWNYSISHIRKKGLMICGTRKFQGDLLEYLENILIPKGLHVEVKTPYLMEGIFPDWKAVIGDDGFEVMWVPELYTWEEIEEQKYYNEDEDVDPYLAFMAEMMQDPRPRVGGLIEESDIQLRGRPGLREVQMVGIGVDVSWSEGETADHVGIVDCSMYPQLVKKNDRDRGVLIPNFCFLRASIGRFPFRSKKNRDGDEVYGIIELITLHWEYLERYYPHVTKIVAIERNNGGIAVIEQARHDKLPWAYNICEDHTSGYMRRKKNNPDTPIKLGITHLKDKTARIFGELQNGIKKGFIKFLTELWGHAFLDELTTFPKGRYDDGADAGGMIKDELKRRFSRTQPNEILEVVQEGIKEALFRRQSDAIRQELYEPWKTDKGRRS